jgi:hypothetical protein
MAVVTATNKSFTLKAYAGDNKTLLAFNFDTPDAARNLAGFTIACQPPGKPAYYLFNELQFQDPSKHAQVSTEKPNSTVNAPIQKYRWTHVPGTNHQGLNPAVGDYRYTVTPRYFDANQSMKPLDSSLSAWVTIPVGPFRKGSLALGFTRGYMQSEAFVHHFGEHTPIIPAGKPLQFDTSTQAGTNSQGETFTFADIYAWMGSTARQQVFCVLNAVLNDPSLHLDVFAYDLNETDVVDTFLKLAAQGRIRIILDNAQLHVTHKDPKTGKTMVASEDEFTALFKEQAKPPAEIQRGCFARYSHDKIFIVSKNGSATQLLTGSTNFSVTGVYVNANHVLVINDSAVAQHYAEVFEQSWTVLKAHPTKSAAAANAFSGTALATQPFTFQSPSVPRMRITYSPHNDSDVTGILAGISKRIDQETSADNGNVLFAVMQLTGSNTPVYNTLSKLHENQSVYSFGISDAPQGTFLYQPGSRNGVMVTGKPGKTTLPAPFDQVPIPPGHEIHDKFIVCGINGSDPVVYCGSSNLATGGEAQNGDNLLEIHDVDVATAFAIEALLLVDHYNFLDRYANTRKAQAAAGSRTTAKTAAGKSSAKNSATKKAAAKRPSAKKVQSRKAAPRKSAAKKTSRKTRRK